MVEIDGGPKESMPFMVVSLLPAKSAEQVFDELSKKYFKHRRVGLLHGKMKPDQKDAIMQQFVNHELDVLVATTVIEVGVDVPNATVMAIENAERFGILQRKLVWIDALTATTP